MAEKINIKVALESKLEQAKNDLGALKKEKVFNSPQGEKNLTKLNGIIQRLSAVDLSKLKGTELTKFLNDFSKLRSLLDSASRSLTVYTKEFEDQQEVVNKAIKELNKRKTSKSDALRLKKDALSKVNLKGHTYFNTETGKQVSNIETIVDLFKRNLLEIRGEKGKKAVSEENYKKITEASGIKGYSEAIDKYEAAKVDVSAQQVVVNDETKKLSELPKVGDVHETTKTIQQNSAEAESLFSDIREQEDKTQEEEISKTTEEINRQIPVIDKQTSSLGRAFKQFTIYNIAVRAAKTAIREAVQTVKELDQYLTEQAMVTGKTRKETYELVGAYQQLALECGATTKEIAQVATEYMKQGKTTQDALVLTQAAVSAAKVARVSVGDSVNYLTTALNGFRLEAEDAMAVSDKFAAVAASSATDYDELAIALSKVASQANLAGMSIDYTTALLTKGLETTREAPETMGTALKTIIARMRELGDYGETLDDGMDINNVETQLAYVDIALRDTNGELRSTEDVLDELGKKWDTLNKNQQAAVAKALAGTRQQSRLIAMMEDYERVTELQEISQRSAGATAAQAATYLEGMEASLNKIQVAWEKIVMTVTDNEVLIGFLDYIGEVLDDIGSFLSTDFGMISALTVVASIGLSILGTKLQEAEINRRNLLATLQENAEKLKSEKTEKRKLRLEKEAYLTALKNADTAREAYKTKLKAAIADAKSNKNTALAAELEKKLAEAQIDDANLDAQYAAERAQTQKEIADLKQEELLLTTQITSNSIQQFQNSSGFMSVLSSVVPILTVVVGLFGLINTFQSIGIGLTKLGTLAIKKQNKEKAKGAAISTGEMVAEVSSAGAKSGGLPGFIAGLAMALGVAAALATVIGGIALGSIAIKNAKQAEKDKTASGTAENINKISNEIYKLNQKSTELNKVVNQFEAIDNKVIKTKQDMEELNSLLESAGDKMDTENQKDDKGDEVEDSSEQAQYNKLQTNEERLTFIKASQAKAEAEADKYRQEQLDKVKNLRLNNIKEFNKLMADDATDADILASQSAIRAIAYNNLYDEIDKLKITGNYSNDTLKDTEELISSLVSNMSALEALDYAENANKMRDLTNSINSIKLSNNEYAADAFLDEGNSIIERIEAYRALENALIGDSVALNSLREAYSDWATLSGWEKPILDFIDATNLSVDQINALYNGYETLQKQGLKITQDRFKMGMDSTLKELTPNMSNLNDVLKKNFGYMLGTGEEFDKNWEILLNQISNTFAETIQDMGQNMEKFDNTINNFYEKSLKWGEMTESEKMDFISENQEMFTGSGGEDLLLAFQTGQYERIEEALATQMETQRKSRLAEVERTLAVEEARAEENQNKAYIAQLKAYKAQLENVENLYQASLELRLEQEENQLKEYKDYLQKQQDALVESLEKRKDAYSKYFDAINKNEEDEDYEEQANLLVSNLSKLGSSTNASAQKQTQELEKQLADLEEERLKELRARAQEAILENMDDEVSEINEKFDKLLENNQALLMAMNGDLKDPATLLSKMLGNEVIDGKTELEMDQYIEDLKATFGNVLGDAVDWEVLKEEIHQLFLNVNGQTINLNEQEQQDVYDAIEKALTQIGKR